MRGFDREKRVAGFTYMCAKSLWRYSRERRCAHGAAHIAHNLFWFGQSSGLKDDSNIIIIF